MATSVPTSSGTTTAVANPAPAFDKAQADAQMSVDPRAKSEELHAKEVGPRLPYEGDPKSLSSLSLQDPSPLPPASSTSTHHYASEPRANDLIQPLPSRPSAPPSLAPRTSAPPLDVTSSGVHSYVPPTPIHLTIHPDPDEEARAALSRSGDASQRATAIAYLQSVHPALPVSNPPTAVQSHAHSRRPSEGAATSMNGLWQPLEPAALPGVSASPSPPPEVRDVHHDQMYASQAAVVQGAPMRGQMTRTGPHDQQSYASTAAVGSATNTRAGATGSYQSVTTPTAAQDSSEYRETKMTGAAAATQAMASTYRPVTTLRPSEGGVVESHTATTSAAPSRVEAAEAVTTAGAAAALSHRQAQVVDSTTGYPEVVHVSGRSELRGEVLVDGAAGAAAASHPYRRVQVFEGEFAAPQVLQVGGAGELRGETIALASQPPALPLRQRFEGAAGASIVNVASAAELPVTATRLAGLRGDEEEPQLSVHHVKVLDSESTGPRVVQVGGTGELRGEAVVVASQPPVLPPRQRFEGDASPAIVDVAYAAFPDSATRLAGMERDTVDAQRLSTHHVQVLDTDSSTPRVLQVGGAGELRGRGEAIAVTSQPAALPPRQVLVGSAAASVVNVSSASEFPSSATRLAGQERLETDAQQLTSRTTRVLDSDSAAPRVVQMGSAGEVRGTGRVAVEASPSSFHAPVDGLAGMAETAGPSIVDVGSAAALPRGATPVAVSSAVVGRGVGVGGQGMAAQGPVVVTEERRPAPAVQP